MTIMIPTIKGTTTAELHIYDQGGAALVFVGGMYAGSVERRKTVPEWNAHMLYRPDDSDGEYVPYPDMWSAVAAVVTSHLLTLARALGFEWRNTDDHS